MGQIVYTPLIALTKLQRACEASGELYGIVRPGIDFVRYLFSMAEPSGFEEERHDID